MIVKRGDIERYDVLFKTFSVRVPVSWDRRRTERRKAASTPPDGERRSSERRGSPPPSWKALGFVVIP